MKTHASFLLRFLLPPFYASLLLSLLSITALFREPLSVLGYAAIVAIYAYVFAGLPSLLFAILLGRFARRRPAFGGRLLRATLLGFVSGALIAAMFGFGGATLFLSLGTAVGFAVEGTVVLLERRVASTV